MDEQNSLPPLDYAAPERRRPRTHPAIGWTAFGALAFLVIASILPFPQRPREPSNRVKCSSNMRQIGQALQMWANDHGGRFPDQLSDALDEDLTPSVFNCPSSNDLPATGAT